MKWSRELLIARRSLRTAMRAASAIAQANARLPGPVRRAPPRPDPAPGVRRIEDFGTNPGRLAMFVHSPPALARRAPLVILLHGCGQTATTFAAEAGWIDWADRCGVPLVLPEQSGENNRGRCFNWFREAHVARGSGEAESIRQMAEIAIARFGSDPSRVFIAGLSAGGAMAAAMLAAYPDLFSGGAVVAGLPVGAANSVTEALARMAEAGPARSREDWARHVLQAGPAGYAGPWPRISIWHGLADDVVDPANAGLLAQQWSAVHGVDSGEVTTEQWEGRGMRWGHAAHPMVELWMLPDLPHVWPAGAIDRVARFWGLGSG